jgi:hypothetical protein
MQNPQPGKGEQVMDSTKQVQIIKIRKYDNII